VGVHGRTELPPDRPQINYPVIWRFGRVLRYRSCRGEGTSG
jgi:allophanate hydrolase subunit 1